MALRWRKDPKPTGLMRVAAGPRGSTLYDGETRYATVNAFGRYHESRGWYWVAGWQSGIPHFNSCSTPVADEATAKADAMAYVKAELKRRDACGEPTKPEGAKP